MILRAVAINDDDEVSRLVFRPKDFLDGIGPLKISKHLYFNEKHNYKESVNCRRLVTNYPKDLHQQGHEKAANDSSKKKQEGKDPVTYEGFVSIRVEAARSINEDNHSFDVIHSPIKNNQAHCDIELTFPDTKPQKAQRNLIIQKLAEGFSEIFAPVQA